MPEIKAPKEAGDSIWSGVYERFDQVNSQNEVFNSALWAEKQQRKAVELLQHLKGCGPIPAIAKSKDYPLAPILAAELIRKENVHLVDYGGSMGQVYLELLAKIPDAETQLKCTIVETDYVIKMVPESISDMPNLSFTTSIQNVTGPADILHLGSVLHYIEHWQYFFDDAISRLNPGIIVLSDLLVGQIPSFVTAQSYYGNKIPVKCINIDEFLKFWKIKGYTLAYRTHYSPLASADYFPNHALPESHRIKTSCHLVFARKS